MNKKELKGLIAFQRNYRFIKNELTSLSKQSTFLKECLVDMTFNLNYLNKLKMLDNINNGYIVLMNELQVIKKKLDKIPDIILLKHLRKIEMKDISYILCEVQLMIIKYMNHISSNKLELIIKLFVGNDNFDSLTLKDKGMEAGIKKMPTK